ncbi:MAG: GH116 family glycosyl hydrolase [Elusimicrobia bacterium]|nr:GH116 family glycosyl hydrolase [Elusimicrobiota bacterium]
MKKFILFFIFCIFIYLKCFGAILDKGEPRIYKGENLSAVAMPIGGIGTGSIWLNGEARLSSWQIFNNINEFNLPDSFFAIRIKPKNGKAQLYALQTKLLKEMSGFKVLDSLSYRGEYPIADIDFEASALPVKVHIKAYNPMIPLDAKNSAIPCAIFQITAKNTSKNNCEVSLASFLQNYVGYPDYGCNRIIYEQDDKKPLLYMTKLDAIVINGLSETLDQKTVKTLSQVADGGGVLLATDVKPGFFHFITETRKELKNPDESNIIFEDFEKGSYPGWKVKGDCFGNKPAGGKLNGQSNVTGFFGKGLVNTFNNGDAATGTLTSKEFLITHKYIVFYIGGGNYKKSTCINMKIDGKVVCSSTGKKAEKLELAFWDVRQYKGKKAVIEIIDNEKGGWGHINVDQISFTNKNFDKDLESLINNFTLSFESAIQITGSTNDIVISDTSDILKNSDDEKWIINGYTSLKSNKIKNAGYKILASAKNGTPLIIEGPFGKGRIVLCLAGGLPQRWIMSIDEIMKKTYESQLKAGNMTLSVIGEKVSALTNWKNYKKIAGDLIDDGKFISGPIDTGISNLGETFNGAISVPFELKPKEEKTVTFIISWYFPTRGSCPDYDTFGHKSNMYCNWFNNSKEVAKYVAANFDYLSNTTQLYHDSIYESNLPYFMIDAFTSQSVIMRSQTCFWSKDGYFGGYEGCDPDAGCCPLNCTHVWNYAQSHARLFPSIGRNMRESDLITWLKPTGETSHRQYATNIAFIDGQAATIVAAYREYQTSPDNSFLDKIWTNCKLAMNWLITKIDDDEDGVPKGLQDNTYDCKISGANTFIGSQYLSALAAAEKMAEIENDSVSASKYKKIRESGMKNQDESLWNGEYYIQVPVEPARNYNTGCLSDQLLGQWWSYQLNLGQLYPLDRVRKAMKSIMKYNYRMNFVGFIQSHKRVVDEESGLLNCTWPKGNRPEPCILYADDIWTGIEYATAGLMIYAGLTDDALQIVKSVRDRYDGRIRTGLNSGPGGNPFNELECGKFYARAMSSWSLLLASQGFIYEGPKGILGFKPNLNPENHVTFFTAAEGWGMFKQTHINNSQTEQIHLSYGKLRLNKLIFEIPKNASKIITSVMVSGKKIPVISKVKDKEVQLSFFSELILNKNETVDITLNW